MTDDDREVDAGPEATRDWKVLVGGCLIPLIGWGGVLVGALYFFLNFEPLDFG